MLRDPMLSQQVLQAAQNTLDTTTDEVPNIDAALLQGWQQHMKTKRQQTQQVERIPHPAVADTALLIRQLWALRELIHAESRGTTASQPPDGPGLAQLWTGWRRICALQQLQRELRRRGRHKRIHMVEQAVKADNVYQAAKQFAPKTARRRLQLRTEQGHLQTAAEEFRTIKQYYETLYAGPAPPQDFLCTRLDFRLEEVLLVIKSLTPGKAMPSYSAPAALWNNLHVELAPQVLQQLNHVFTPGLLVLPAAWCISELVLLPKPGKALTSPSHLRPIALLPPIAKVLASVLASRIQPFAAAYLENTPQFAYLCGRSLQQALERVISHCAETRALIAQQAINPHTRRSGREVLQIAGGLQLSLDVSQAYDGVSRSHLREALLEAQIPEALTTAILAIHNQAVLRISHDQYTDNIKLLTGLRQGCSLSPILWSIYTGWLLRRLEATSLVPVSKAGTVFADDAHFAWLIKTGSQLEAAYSGVRAVLNHLAAYNLKVSIDKTVILVELRGSKAAALLKKYVIQKETGPHMRFKVGGEHMDIKIVSKHVYLGLQQKIGTQGTAPVAAHPESAFDSSPVSRSPLPQNMAAPGLRGQLAEATEELRLIESLVPEGSQGFRKSDHPRRMQIDDTLPETANLEDDKDHPAKWRRPDNKGQGGRGKGHSSNQPDETYEPYWGESWGQSWSPQRQGANRADAQLKELQHLRHRVDLLTTLVLRHDNALNILAQDQTYMIFVRTDIPGNLASILYEAGKAWNDLKASNPEKLEAPMRVILFQKLLFTVKARLEQILTSEDKLHQAQNLHWITEDGASLNAMKWDPEHNRHVVNKELPVVEIMKAKSIFEEMIILGRHPRSINRFHATRTMAETYTSPTLTFKLDLGLRTTEAGQMWAYMNQLAHSALWVAAGTYARHNRLQRDPLAQKVAQTQRTQGVLRDVDEGWSLPLSICPTGAILWGAECVSVQDLIDGWTSQAEAHALTVASDVIVIQVDDTCRDSYLFFYCKGKIDQREAHSSYAKLQAKGKANPHEFDGYEGVVQETSHINSPIEEIYFTGNMLSKYEAVTESLKDVINTDGDNEETWEKFDTYFTRFLNMSWATNWDGTKYDIVFFGVSGYTGYLMIQYLKSVAARHFSTSTPKKRPPGPHRSPHPRASA
ncbi:unnamed protein product [Symbiodinium microadriaticum]|nr:unnamed protein product [Symbiodinium microadriaticum]